MDVISDFKSAVIDAEDVRTLTLLDSIPVFPAPQSTDPEATRPPANRALLGNTGFSCHSVSKSRV